MDAVVTENNSTVTTNEERQTAQIQIQVSGTGETQMVTLPLSMANAITASQPGQTTTNLLQAAAQASDVHDSAKRRELLSRRPSYRKILNELSRQPDQRVKDEPGSGSKSSESSESESGGQISSMQAPSAVYQTGNGSVPVHQQPQPAPLSAAINHEQNSVTSVTGIQTFSMANALAQGQATLVQGDGTTTGNTLWMPTNHVVVQGDNSMYQIRPPTSTAAIPSVVMGGGNMQSPQQMAEEASRKREMRLMKNREAAKECRRRKKEYVKCLETRVAVLENQNKQLIDELKSLKELYVHKQVD